MKKFQAYLIFLVAIFTNSCLLAFASTPTTAEKDAFVKKDNFLVDFTKNIFAVFLNNKVLKKLSTETSASVYSERNLSIYDNLVWKFNSPALWRIRKRDITNLYESSTGQNHCEIAVGTGLFLRDFIRDQEKSSMHLSQLTLMDLNENTINVASKRISLEALKVGKEIQFSSELVDITQPESIPDYLKGLYDSVAANFLFHCLHGEGLTCPNKYNAFNNIASLVNPDHGIFFGSTVLGKELLDDAETAGRGAVNIIKNFNEVGIFGNEGDTMQDLEKILRELFHEVDVYRLGYCGVWKASKPKVLKK